MSNKRVTIQCVVVDILESNLRCLVNYKCIHECTLNNLRTILKKIYLFKGNQIGVRVVTYKFYSSLKKCH